MPELPYSIWILLGIAIQTNFIYLYICIIHIHMHLAIHKSDFEKNIIIINLIEKNL